MIKIEQLEAPEPPTKIGFLGYLWRYLLDGNGWFFDGDWRQGQEISKIVITQRFYQISPSSTQA